jgi:hypothetical protein
LSRPSSSLKKDLRLNSCRGGSSTLVYGTDAMTRLTLSKGSIRLVGSSAVARNGPIPCGGKAFQVRLNRIVQSRSPASLT